MDTDTDTDFFAAKRTRTDPTEFRRKKVRVRVVEFSYNWMKNCRLIVRMTPPPTRLDRSTGVWTGSQRTNDRPPR